ncbi:hypothetical protein LTR64_002565 [Lithohypha guttulata]|uniref:uncharacterized protein n=1 Tax=Lithohypha guttulata TaxID=1690604 RepID=UPI00315D561E
MIKASSSDGKFTRPHFSLRNWVVIEAKELDYSFQQLDLLSQFLFARYLTDDYSPVPMAELLQHGSDHSQLLTESENKMPVRFQKMGRRGVYLSDIADLSRETLPDAVALLGRHALGSAIEKDSEWRASFVGQGLWLLETSAILGSSDGAAAFTTALSDEFIDAVKHARRLSVSDTVARALIVQTVETAIETGTVCSWPELAAYLQIEYSPNRLARKTAEQLQGSISILKRCIRLDWGIRRQRLYWDYFMANNQGPFEHLLKIVKYCLLNSSWILARREPDEFPLLQHEALMELRDEAVLGAVLNDDPEACFVYAMQNADFGTRDWLQLMRKAGSVQEHPYRGHAQSTGNPTACWLLALYYWQKNGLISATTTKRSLLDNSPVTLPRFQPLVNGLQALFRAARERVSHISKIINESLSDPRNKDALDTSEEFEETLGFSWAKLALKTYLEPDSAQIFAGANLDKKYISCAVTYIAMLKRSGNLEAAKAEFLEHDKLGRESKLLLDKNEKDKQGRRPNTLNQYREYGMMVLGDLKSTFDTDEDLLASTATNNVEEVTKMVGKWPEMRWYLMKSTISEEVR